MHLILAIGAVLQTVVAFSWAIGHVFHVFHAAQRILRSRQS